jgi:hypothetical protein
VWSFDRAIRLHAHNVIAGQISLVDSCGRDPDISRIIQNRDIPARSCRHAVPVNPIHRFHDLVARVRQLSDHPFVQFRFLLKVLKYQTETLRLHVSLNDEPFKIRQFNSTVNAQRRALMDAHRLNVQDATLAVNRHAPTCSARNAI